MRRFEPVEHLARDRQRIVYRQRLTGYALGERHAGRQLHDQRVLALGLLQAIHVGDVRMIERGEQFRFAAESREPLRVTFDRRRQHFTATSRLRMVSTPRYTCPMPPSPIGATISSVRFGRRAETIRGSQHCGSNSN